MNKDLFTINCTGDAVVGDTILFTENVFGGFAGRSRFSSKPRFLGERIIVAKILKDSYGKKFQQHTFTIEVLESEGYSPLTVGTITTRKGRNIYRIETKRIPWFSEEERNLALLEKHSRGSVARTARDNRRQRKLEEMNNGLSV